MGIAWSIHFVQDIIIFTALSMININHNLPNSNIIYSNYLYLANELYEHTIRFQ
jgi:hypothetical protein